MAVQWPSYLPIPLRADYGFTSRETAARTPMSGGNTRVRKIAPEGPEQLSLRWVMSDDQQALFKTWFATVAMSGSALVDMPIRTLGRPVETQTVVFLSRPSYSLQFAQQWQVSANVETRTPRLYNVEEFSAAEQAGGESNFSSFADFLDELINRDAPQGMPQQ